MFISLLSNGMYRKKKSNMSVIKCLYAGVQAAHDVTHAFFINVLIGMGILDGQNKCNLIIEFNSILFLLFFEDAVCYRCS